MPAVKISFQSNSNRNLTGGVKHLACLVGSEFLAGSEFIIKVVLLRSLLSNLVSTHYFILSFIVILHRHILPCIFYINRPREISIKQNLKRTKQISRTVFFHCIIICISYRLHGLDTGSFFPLHFRLDW